MAEKKVADIKETEVSTQKNRYLTFAVGAEYYGMEIKYVTEIIGIQEITQVPGLPLYVKGIINLRGIIIPVIDVRLRFNKEPLEYNDRTCVIVIDINEITLGLIVDSVAEVQTIPENDIAQPPQINNSYNNRYIQGIGKVGKEVILLLDCEKLLTEEDIEDLSENL